MRSVIGQPSIKKRLERVFTGASGHSYLVLGASGMGKHTIARAMAKALLCFQPDAKGACGDCPSCRYVEAQSHPDYHEVLIPPKDKNIKVETIRSRVCSDASIYPQISRRKVYLIDGNGLNEQGQNALLKTIEEPPGDLVFLLMGDELSRFLPTVISRSEKLVLEPYTESELISILCSQTEISQNEAHIVARFSDGIPGRALALAADRDFIVLRSEAVELFFSLFRMRVSDRLTRAYSFFDANKDRVHELLSVWLLVTEDLTVLRTVQDKSLVMNRDLMEKMIVFLRTYPWSGETGNKKYSLILQTLSALKANCSYESTICSLLISL